jgi:hypothetical protein
LYRLGTRRTIPKRQATICGIVRDILTLEIYFLEGSMAAMMLDDNAGPLRIDCGKRTSGNRSEPHPWRTAPGDLFDPERTE